VIFFLTVCAYYYITSPVVVVDGGIHGDFPSGVVCSGVSINDATDVGSLLTMVLTVIPPMEVEEAASWTASNYQAHVICANVIDRIDCTFNRNQRCVFLGPAFF
jgi:hypothetical protein